MEHRKPRIGLLGLMLELYDTALPDLKGTQTTFAHELIRESLSFADVAFPGICNTREQVDRAVAGLENEEVDLILVVHFSYAPSLISLPALLRTSRPILLFNTQKLFEFGPDSPPTATTENHGMHGVQDLSNVLVRSGRAFELVTGHYRDPEALTEVREWVEAARAASTLRRARIGILGYPFEGMGDFGLDTTAFLSQVGVTVVQIPMGEVARLAVDAPSEEIQRLMEEDRGMFTLDERLTKEDHARALRLEWALRRIAEERNLSGFSMHFGAVAEDGRLETVPFLAASKMLADGYGYGGEGDASSAAVVAMMQDLCGPASFTEMFTMDFANGQILMTHMGEANWRMARKDEPVRLIRKDFPFGKCDPPASLCFSMEPGSATLANLVTVADGRLKLIAAEVDIVDFRAIPTFQTPHYKITPWCPLPEFLNRYSREGGSHHLAIVFGEHAGKMAKVAQWMDVDFVQV